MHPCIIQLSNMSGLVQPVITQDGDRIIPGTRRPDGTVRKERRIRLGYTPQDEVVTYQSKGTVVRHTAPVPEDIVAG